MTFSNDLDKGPVATAWEKVNRLIRNAMPDEGTWNARDHMPRERSYLRYQLYRSQARRLAGASVANLQRELEAVGPTTLDLSKTRFEPIDALALNAFEQWDNPYFTWGDVVGWKAREHRYLDIAIWFDTELCGLCFANPNNSRRRLRIVRLEGRPGAAHPLKKRVGTLAMLVVERYAKLVRSEVLEIQEPLKGAVSTYNKLGFSFDNDGRLVKTLENPVP